MNRRDFRRIARIRLREAGALLTSRNFSGSYYLCGYVVECGLKACIAKRTRRYEFPDRRTVNERYTHDLERLVRVAGLALDLENEMAADPAFATNWGIVKDWTEESRYQVFDRAQATAPYEAVTDADHGVLRWLMRFW